MKTIYLIGGTMGVGKTTVSQQLKKELPNSSSSKGIGSVVAMAVKLDCRYSVKFPTARLARCGSVAQSS